MSLACGSAAGLVSSTATFPLDLVRRRLQLRAQSGEVPPSFRTMFGNVIKKEGVRGLYAGILPEYYKASRRLGGCFAAVVRVVSAAVSWDACCFCCCCCCCRPPPARQAENTCHFVAAGGSRRGHCLLHLRDDEEDAGSADQRDAALTWHCSSMLTWQACRPGESQHAPARPFRDE